MTTQLERKRFNRDWRSALFFMVVVILPTFWVLLAPQTRSAAAIGTSIASTLVGLIGWWFLTREGVRAKDVGLGRKHWIYGVVLFLIWWVLVTAVDWVGSWVADLLGCSLSRLDNYEWSLPTVLEMVSKFIFVGFGEEIAFRGYLHNKLVAVTKRRWSVIILAALMFGLWHTPADIATQGTLLAPLANSVLFALVGLLFFHLPYEWTGLLPFLALFHGWNDFLVLITLRAPTVVGAVAGYLLMGIALWAYRQLGRQPGKEEHKWD